MQCSPNARLPDKPRPDHIYLRLHYVDSKHILPIEGLATNRTSPLSGIDKTLKSTPLIEETYIDAGFTKHMPAKSNSGILPTVITNPASCNPLQTLAPCY
jgi:hypothetical protein